MKCVRPDRWQRPRSFASACIPDRPEEDKEFNGWKTSWARTFADFIWERDLPWWDLTERDEPGKSREFIEFEIDKWSVNVPNVIYGVSEKTLSGWRNADMQSGRRSVHGWSPPRHVPEKPGTVWNRLREAPQNSSGGPEWDLRSNFPDYSQSPKGVIGKIERPNRNPPRSLF